MRTHLWVVQMLCRNGYYRPTVGVGINRAQGRSRLKEWQKRCSAKEFRLRKYIPKED